MGHDQAPRRVAAVLVPVLALSTAGSAAANEFAFGWVLAGSPIYTGFLGTAELRTRPSHSRRRWVRPSRSDGHW